MGNVAQRALSGSSHAFRTRLGVGIIRTPMLYSVRNKEAWFLVPEEALEPRLLLGE